MNRAKRTQEFRENRRTEGGILLNDAAHKDNHVQGPISRQKVHQHMHHSISHLREAHRAGVDGLDKETAVHRRFLLISILRTEDLAFEDRHHFFNVPGGDLFGWVGGLIEKAV